MDSSTVLSTPIATAKPPVGATNIAHTARGATATSATILTSYPASSAWIIMG